METENIFISEKELDRIIAFVRERFAVDFSGYARSSLSRRVARFKKNIRIESADELCMLLESSSEKLRLFIHEITVNTTEMFRDPEFWRYLRQEVLPKLAEFNAIRIWHAGCSTGEEVYSMLILLYETGLIDRAKIIATDINSDVLHKTREGIFRFKDFEAYSRAYEEAGGQHDFSYYFDMNDESFAAKEFLKAPLNLKLHNLTHSTPFSKFDLIMCRNVMIYFNTALQTEVIRLFAGSLFKNGILCIGKKENIAFLESASSFRDLNPAERVYSLREKP